MKSNSWLSVLSVLGVAATFFCTSHPAVAVPMGHEEGRKPMVEAYGQGNYKEAYEGLHKLLLDPANASPKLGDDLNMAVQCLQKLGRVKEIDSLLEDTVKAHPDDWRLLEHAAQQMMKIPHQGFIIAGEFERGPHRGGGRVVNAVERDRIRALQWMVQAMPSAMKNRNRAEAGDFLMALADMFLNNRGYSESWRLQYLSDLKTLPDYEDGWMSYRQPTGAPVDAKDNPVFYSIPKTFETAENDGQRWRWCLAHAAELNPGQADAIQMQIAEFLWHQFGVQTMAASGWRFGREDTDDTLDRESGIYSLSKLGEDETIARLASGIKRFKLPDEFNYIKILQKIAAHPKSSQAMYPLERLAQIFENRRQYDRAAEYWRSLIAYYPNKRDLKRQSWQPHLDQIVGAWGRFEPCRTQPAGQGATVEYRFRNGRQVDFVAYEINVEKLLDDVKALLKSNPRQLDWHKTNVANLGYRLVERNEKQYLGRQVAEWQMKLDPRPNHFDRRVTVTTPLSTPGAYLVRAKMVDGNTCFIVLWVDDTAIVEKPMSDKNYYFVADAVTGRPVPRANVEFFGWRRVHNNRSPRHRIVTKQFAEFTDAGGQVVLGPKQQPQDMGWLITARTPKGRFAYLGFDRVWYGRWYDAEYNATKVYTITDRPVYRPAQKLHYKFWVRHAKYDMSDTSAFADREFTVEFHSPRGDTILSEVKRTDAYGGIEGEYNIPDDAALGVYRLGVQGVKGLRITGGGSFRVEEYKKPEYEVTVDAPERPVMLGDKVTATIKARYYFGSPVTRAKVKYTVRRSTQDERWYPAGEWDWLYGSGYWWFGYDYTWFPGWRQWGCPRPWPFWWPHHSTPPELIADREAEIGPDGTLKVEIDTAAAKALYPNEDQSYTITAEVIDQSRRTIIGTANVLVAREPFKVYAWLDRGYYRVGDTIQAQFSARTPDGRPVQGQGELRLLKITYKDGKPVETPVQTWQLDTNAEGRAKQAMTASQAGQYRIAYKLKSSAGGDQGAGKVTPQIPKSPNPQISIEGGYVFTVTGEGFDGAQFRFNHLELVPDKRTYAPGDTVKLQINTDRTGGTVLLFVRPVGGIYLPPKLLHLDGKSTIQEIGVLQKDMPNFFVEAVTVADGRVYTEARDIAVPPASRILGVDIKPSKEAYKPGEKAKVKVRLTDSAGKPFVGTTVVAIYDKSLEYISGGSNVPDIKAFFWKWRRHHHPRTESSLERDCRNMNPPRAVGMSDLGVFGGAMERELDEDTTVGEMFGPSHSRVKGRIGLGYSMAAGAPMAAQAAPIPVADQVVSIPEKGAFSGDVDTLHDNAQPGVVEPKVRTKFADTALWVGDLTTREDGTAEVALDMPENLTTWRIKVWGLGPGTRVGQGFADVVTRKDLIIRMEAPRFFVQTDEVVLSAIVHNYLKSKKSVKVRLELPNPATLRLLLHNGQLYEDGERGGYRLGDGGESFEWRERSVVIAPNGEARVDWWVKVLDAGEAVIRMKALTDEESDAMEQRFPCYLHGMLKMDSYCGAIRPEDASGQFTIDVPEKRQPDQSRLEVRFTPTLAGAMIGALPYLVDYPYGCTEQTLNRFLPTVITQKVLLDMKLDLKEIEKVMQGRKSLNPQISKSPNPSPLAPRPAPPNPVFDQDKVREMVKSGVERLTEMQCSDGGWGWFSGWGERSYPHTTAQVVHGLQIARQNDVALVPGVLERGVKWLKRYQDKQVQLLKNAAVKDKPQDMRWKSEADNLDAFVYMVLVDADVSNADMREFLYRDRTDLSVYGMTLYGLALQRQGDREKLAMILRNIGQYVEQDDENQTAWLRMPQNSWWYWYGSAFEAEAYYLKLLARTDPKGSLASRLVKYLLNNRRNATYWNSTRDTALCVEAFADFLRRSGEGRPEMTVEVYYDGQLKKAVEISPKNLFTFDNKFVIEGDAVTAGKHTVELKKKGTGSLYYDGYLTTFTLEDFIKRAGLEVKVVRKYYKLVKADKTIKAAGSRGQVVDQQVEKYERQELPNLSVVKSGDLVEIELTIDSKNDYEYLVFEDMKPAGFEPVDVRSGYTGNELGAYVEFRDNRVVFFVHRLARGRHSVSYRMRAEIPGKFSALPARARAMYAPELKGNSNELKIGVED